MSGVVGIFDRGDGAVSPDDVAAMHERIAHRGPDGGDRYRDDRAGVGHQSLAATPEARYDDQPLCDGDLVLTADVRLDNRGELLRELSVRTPPSQVPDSDLLLAAYRRWGDRCVEHLVGAFAFAVWDRAERRIFCARDHVGVKPLYYHACDEAFAFASELKALLSLPTVPGSVDETRIGAFLTGRLEDETTTMYESIRRLPPAHAMTVGEDGVRRWEYWDLDPGRTLAFESDADYERRFRDLFERAVRCRLRTADVVGADLSGGLDSSAVTVVARDLLPEDEPLYTFSNVFDDAPSSDEREYIEAVTDRAGITPHHVFLDDRRAMADRERVASQFDTPPHNTLHFGEWVRTRRTAETDATVVLSGALGDSAINYGLGLLPQLFRTGRWLALERELSAMGDIVGASRRHLFVRHVLSPLVPDGIKRARRRLRGEAVLEAAANPTIADSFADRIGLRDRYRAVATVPVRDRTADRRRQYHSLRTGQNVANLETRDLVSAAFGVEPRYPFADKRLLEFSLAIPPSQQLADGWTRSIVRRSLADVLPESIRRRPWKTSLNEGFWNALERETESIRAVIDDPGPLAAYVDVDALERALDRFSTEPNSRDARALWRALSLSTWFEAYGRHPARPPLPDELTTGV